MSTACLLSTVEAQESLFTKAFYQCLHKNLALLCGFVCDRKISPKKIGQCRYFWVFRTDQKKKNRSSANPPPPPPFTLVFFDFAEILTR